MNFLQSVRVLGANTVCSPARHPTAGTGAVLEGGKEGRREGGKLEEVVLYSVFESFEDNAA